MAVSMLGRLVENVWMIWVKKTDVELEWLF
jgi:hypothetical protein